MIYHITSRLDWESRERDTEFIPQDYHREGFIHCCTLSQVPGVLQRYFSGKTGLVLLHLDESKLTSELKFEVSTDNEKFPHLYGPINRQAVVRVEKILPD